MTAFFLHGVPDTPAMWTPLLEALGEAARDAVRPAMPGFGVPVPAGFDCTKEAYARWLIGELEAAAAAQGPLDVVGHDWGALLMVHAVNARPDLIRTWTVANALPDPDYVWHRAARAWQTPMLGEFAMAMAQFRDMGAALTQAGMPAALAEQEKAHMDKTMRQSILKLYRSAVTVGQAWGADLSRLPARGLVVWGDQDPFVQVSIAERFCARWGVPLHREGGAGHWAVIERPAVVADVLRRHWE